MIRNFIFLKDFDTEYEDAHPTKLSLEKKRIVEQSWNMLKLNKFSTIGPIFYSNLFRLHPSALNFFSFRNQKNYLDSSLVKMQSANVVSIIGRGVESLDNFETASAFFMALGKEHQGRNVRKEHFIFIEDGFVATIE